ncbi:MAG: YbhB/YbcL family Raf kinase inhibitor-like protein [Acidimicrobiia bacterium]
MLLTSPSFGQGKGIPKEFSCEGDDISPELNIENLPANTVTLALIMDDPDAPGGTWVHWVAFDFPPTDVIPQGIPLLGIGGSNSWGVMGYGGPCPPTGTHRYFFRLFALDGTLELPEGSTKEEVLKAMEGKILDQTELVGTYTRP